jgi:hypothetical protein
MPHRLKGLARFCSCHGIIKWQQLLRQNIRHSGFSNTIVRFVRVYTFNGNVEPFVKSRFLADSKTLKFERLLKRFLNDPGPDLDGQVVQPLY